MVTKHECENAVYNDAEWYCAWCERFYREKDENVVTDHDYSFDKPLCKRCDADMIKASEAYKYD